MAFIFSAHFLQNALLFFYTIELSKENSSKTHETFIFY